MEIFMINDPYKVLGLSSNATNEQVKNAYRILVQQNMNNEKKLAELNSAYDAIMNNRRGNTGNEGYNEVRRLIKQGSYNDAESVLMGLDSSKAEWSFLMGSICYGKGYLNDAYTYFAKAAEIEPNNAEYSAAFKSMNEKKNGYMNGSSNQAGYNTFNNTSGCGFCNTCQGLICADCCCECMGGDCIPCC